MINEPTSSVVVVATGIHLCVIVGQFNAGNDQMIILIRAPVCVYIMRIMIIFPPHLTTGLSNHIPSARIFNKGRKRTLAMSL